MYVITLKDSNELIMHGEQLDYMSNGYPILVNENTAFPNHMVNVHSVAEMPEDVEDGKYCYTEEDGFWLNLNYEEPNPYGTPDELVEQIKNDAIAQVQEGVRNND